MSIELEFFILNVLIRLYNYDGTNIIGIKEIRNCMNIVNMYCKLNNIELNILNYNDCVNKSEFIDSKFDGNEVMFCLKNNVDLEKVKKCLKTQLEFESIFNSAAMLEYLGLPVPEISLDEYLSKVLNRPEVFYSAVGSFLCYEEYYIIKEFLQNKSCSNCSNVSCLNRHSTLACGMWDNKVQIGKCKVLNTFNIK